MKMIIRVISKTAANAYKCIELKEDGSQASTVKFVYVTGDLPTTCPFLSVEGVFEQTSSKSFVLLEIVRVQKLKLTKKDLYAVLFDDDGKKILTQKDKSALNISAESLEQCMARCCFEGVKKEMFRTRMADYYEFEKNDRFTLAPIIPNCELAHMDDDAIYSLFSSIKESPWRVLFACTRVRLGLKFKTRIAFARLLCWNESYGEHALPPIIQHAFELYERIFEQQGGVASTVPVPASPEFGWLLSNGVIAMNDDMLQVDLASDCVVAERFSASLNSIKTKILLLDGAYSSEMHDFLESKFGTFNPFVASTRLDFLNRAVGIGQVFNCDKFAKLSVFAGAEAIPPEQFMRWIHRNHSKTQQIILTGTRTSAYRFRLFESLLNAWPEKIVPFTVPQQSPPIALPSSHPARWLADAKKQVGGHVLVVTDDDNVQALCAMLGIDPKTFSVGDVVRHGNREYCISRTRLWKGNREVAVDKPVSADYGSASKLRADLFFKKGRDVVQTWVPLDFLLNSGLKHAQVVGIGEFVERCAAVVLATSEITDAQLEYASTKADRVFYVGAVVIEPPRKKRRFTALERLL
jgi:hypothetical protein